MSNQICSAIENALSDVVCNFQSNPHRFWNERDIHWMLFHYLKQYLPSYEKYPTELIRAEFPTLATFGADKPARGHYDLAVLDSVSYFSSGAANMKAQSAWNDYLPIIKITAAIEIKLWLSTLNPSNMAERADWDIKKLTHTGNNVDDAYFVNFVQLNFKSAHMKDHYRQLREYLVSQKKPSLNILCVPADPSIQPNVADNWV